MPIVDILKAMHIPVHGGGIACRAWNLAIGVSNSMKARREQKDLGDHLIGNIGFWRRKFFVLTTTFKNLVVTQRYTPWTIWVERIDLSHLVVWGGML